MQNYENYKLGSYSRFYKLRKSGSRAFKTSHSSLQPTSHVASSFIFCKSGFVRAN